ncbi:hypothetical protein [Halopiger xanaduensis]|uniref:Uncharacterized protein n=1 Tax=Halopiger xanaduensis (strain DSM 18323 / JCM 14033 / SH-6) TaxID=797210 RepID=F8D9U9_HALXS|nr:hypothetical protein [Halopiger xanaduensis]AEH35726.1 hypothetical protein Halxa_1092 [Halopiger xanaduensis SH-6]
MYERTFGTDWETLEDRDEVLWRAFALGVAEALGKDHPGELERISDATATNYDRSFAELAYQKGRQHVRQLEGEGSPREIWQQLVTEKNELDLWADPAGSGGSSDDTELDLDDKIGLPQSLQGIRIDTLPSDSTDRVRRPSFLEKENAKDRERYAASDRRRSRSDGRRSAESAGGKDGDETDSDDGDGPPTSAGNDSRTGSQSGSDST